jgi:pimeloyl-ACP methyl ester carboxylesterase
MRMMVRAQLPATISPFRFCSSYHDAVDFYYGIAPVLVVLVAIVIVWLSIQRISRLRNKTISTSRKIAERIVLGSITLVAIVIAASSAWNAIALHSIHPPGQWYTVNGHRMRIDCTGSSSPTLILDAGLGNDGLIWGGVQPVLAKTTRVCSYDRAGFGWSDPLSPPRDADRISAELHGLLHAAGITGPVVLMGHSIAGIYIRDYATRYPDQVAGLIFVDGSTPLQNRNPAFQREFAKKPFQWLRDVQGQALFVAGMPRWFGQCSHRLPGFDTAAAKLQAEDLCRTQWSAINAEMASFDRDGEETAHTGPYGALPVLIFSQDPAKDASPIARAWNQMQEDLKQLSTRSRRVIARGSTHYIQIDRPELIEREVPLFIEQIRGTGPDTTNYGSTVTE